MSPVRVVSRGSTDQSTPTRGRDSWALALFLAWLCSAAGGLWWFEWHQPQARLGAALRTVAFDPDTLGGPPALQDPQGRVLVLSMIDRECPCAAAAAERSVELRRRFSSDRVRFIELGPPAGRSVAPEPFDMLPRDLAARLWARIPAFPAAIVLARDGALVYLGPWTTPAWCSSGGGDLLDRAIAAAAAGQPVRAQSMLAAGCFCANSRSSSLTLHLETQ
jgi:hypothetical protein